MFMLENVKRRLEIQTPEWDDTIQAMIDGVRARADSFMGISYSEVEDEEEVFDGGVSILHLKYANVTVSSLTLDGVAQDSTTFEVYPERGVIKKVNEAWEGEEWSTGKRILTVTYSGGYNEDNLPAGLREVLIKQVTYEFRRRKDPGLSSVTQPDGSVNKWDMEEWLPDVLKELQRRQRLHV